MSEYGIILKRFEATFIMSVMEAASLDTTDATSEVMYESIGQEVSNIHANGAGVAEFTEPELVRLYWALNRTANGRLTDHTSEKKLAKAINSRLADEHFEGDGRKLARWARSKRDSAEVLD